MERLPEESWHTITRRDAWSSSTSYGNISFPTVNTEENAFTLSRCNCQLYHLCYRLYLESWTQEPRSSWRALLLPWHCRWRNRTRSTFEPTFYLLLPAIPHAAVIKSWTEVQKAGRQGFWPRYAAQNHSTWYLQAAKPTWFIKTVFSTISKVSAFSPRATKRKSFATKTLKSFEKDAQFWNAENTTVRNLIYSGKCIPCFENTTH